VQRTVHTAEHMAYGFHCLGVPLQDVPRAQLFAPEAPVAARYAVIHPFASAPEKQGALNDFAKWRAIWTCGISSRCFWLVLKMM